MSTIAVAVPVLHHTRRFHLEKGRRWNVFEHLVLHALTQKPRTVAEMAQESELPRRVVLEALIRLMRAGWVELRASDRDVTFHATERGKAVSTEDDLPAVTTPSTRWVSFALDLVSNSVFRRRDLTLLRVQDWRARTAGQRAVEVELPKSLPKDLGHVSSLLSALLDEDEHLLRVEASDRAPAPRVAAFVVRNGKVEGLPPRAAADLKDAILEAARRAPARPTSDTPTTISIATIPKSNLRPVRTTAFRHDDVILGGLAHQKAIDNVLRRARQRVIVHSTFIDLDKFDRLLPAIRVAADHGCQVDILWGQTSKDGGLVKSLTQAGAVEAKLRATGLSSMVRIHRFSTKSHAKLLVFDDGNSATHAIVGSCNWLYSGFESFEASVRLKDPGLVSDVLYELAELARPSDGALPALTLQLAQHARETAARPPIPGSTKIKVLIGEEHDDCVLRARDEAKSRITVISHRLGVTAKPAIIIPTATAARERGVNVELFYGLPSGPVQGSDATDAKWVFQEQGVSLTAVYRPRVHAKALLWDDNCAVITSMNWLSADSGPINPRGEIGVSIAGSRSAAFLRDQFEIARSLA